jgi:HAD superfamily hydrolase (TIGR01662 family)
VIRGVFFDFWDTLIKLPDGVVLSDIRGRASDRVMDVLSENVTFDDPDRFRTTFDVRRTENFRRADETMREITTDVSIAQALADCDLPSAGDGMLRRASDAVYDPYLDAIELCDGARSAVVRCREAGLSVGILSNTTWRSFVDRALNKFGMLPLFDPVISSADISIRKPDTEIFRIALSAWGFDADEVLMVGDNPLTDVDGARRVGMRTVWYASHGPTGRPGTRPDPPAEVTISHLDELMLSMRSAGML